MVGLTAYALITVLTPFIGGVILIALGARAPVRAGLVLAILAAALTLAGAIALASNRLPEGPLLIHVLPIGNQSIVFRLDGFTAWLAVGLAGWVQPVLIWMTTPRGNGEGDQRPTLVPLGLGLIATSLGLGAVLNDNLLLIALCWAGAGLTAWLLARPTPLGTYTTDDWVDLVLLTGGAILTTLALIPQFVLGHSLSLYNLAGRNPAGAFWDVVLMLALAFAAGAYPFALWVRRVCQGIMTDAVGVVLLIVLPLGVVLAARLVVVMAGTPDGWPTWHVGPATIPLNILWLILGTATIIVSGLTSLFERDLPVLTAMLGLTTIGWAFIALGTGDVHALIGVVFLLLAYILGVGTLLSVWASWEWADRELDIAHLPGLAALSVPHALAVVLGGLTLVGFPLLLGFNGIAAATVGLINLGGAAALVGALGWVGSALAFAGFIHAIRHAFTQSPQAPEPAPGLAAEGTAMLIPLVLLIVAGVAPELLLIGKPSGVATQAAASLAFTGTTVPDLTSTPLGFSLGTLTWLPGLYWAVALGGAVVVVLTTALLGHRPAPSPVFTGGVDLPERESPTAPSDAWDDMALVPRSQFVLPGPRRWREDIGNLEGWPGIKLRDETARSEEDDEGDEATDEVVITTVDEVDVIEATDDFTEAEPIEPNGHIVDAEPIEPSSHTVDAEPIEPSNHIVEAEPIEPNGHITDAEPIEVVPNVEHETPIEAAAEPEDGAPPSHEEAISDADAVDGTEAGEVQNEPAPSMTEGEEAIRQKTDGEVSGSEIPRKTAPAPAQRPSTPPRTAGKRPLPPSQKKRGRP